MADPIDTAELRRLREAARRATENRRDLENRPGAVGYEAINGARHAERDALAAWRDARAEAAPLLLDALDSTRKALAESEAAGAVQADGMAGIRRVLSLASLTDREANEKAHALAEKCSAANLPASVRRHVAEHEALRELASFIPHECMWPAKRCAGCDGIKAARAKLDAARRGEVGT